jgi:hypothetical protein
VGEITLKGVKKKKRTSLLQKGFVKHYGIKKKGGDLVERALGWE